MKRTAKEWAEITMRDIERRKVLREKGIKDADSFLSEHRLKENKRLSRIRCRNYKGK